MWFMRFPSSQVHYLGVGNGIGSFLQVACWTITGERRVTQIRSLYLKSLLRQDVEFFDKEVNIGEVVGKISTDTFVIQGAMGEKVRKFIEVLSSFFGGSLVAFIRGWQLALVMLSMIPLLVLSAALMATILAKMAARGQTTYTKAAVIVEETIGSIRTVAAFTGEKQAVNKYDRSLKCAYELSVMEGFAVGMGLGATFDIIYFGYSLGIWFGTKMILEKGYTGGDVINVIVAVVAVSIRLHLSGRVVAGNQLYCRSFRGSTTRILAIYCSTESNIQKLQLKWLRQQMGLVSKEPVLFNDTIRANIAYGKQGDATEAEIVAAAEFANARHFISGLQQGYDT